MFANPWHVLKLIGVLFSLFPFQFINGTHVVALVLFSHFFFCRTMKRADEWEPIFRVLVAKLNSSICNLFWANLRLLLTEGFVNKIMKKEGSSSMKISLLQIVYINTIFSSFPNFQTLAVKVQTSFFHLFHFFSLYFQLPWKNKTFYHSHNPQTKVKKTFLFVVSHSQSHRNSKCFIICNHSFENTIGIT